ncbi:peptidase T [Erysipelothrix urinaevulpis]|uniref:peptidase T n=1 Tax=Erysipelothrix urinaevulpis TaxID=2683717 RepID=UPI001359F30B|nr:peptidase T [Erysipelothrix urinaevulpis]
MKEKLLERLVRYCKINTRSDENSTSVPSTKIQFDLANVLLEECIEIGLSDVSMDEHGIVTALLPSNLDRKVPTIGFIAHMDTADFNSENVVPRVIENYDGKDIVLNEALGIISKVDVFPNLKNHIGKTLVVTDGTTLLGADDKAGIAAIMTAMDKMIQDPSIPHGDIKIAFTIDEEIGTGASYFDVEGFAADFAYTLDGSALGELEYETFNAASASITFNGVSVHPGSAKDTMVNALVLAHEFYAALPHYERPEHTEHYEGFYMPMELNGNSESATLTFIIRDHDRAQFENRKKTLHKIGKEMNARYGHEHVTVKTDDTYYNMREVIEEKMEIVDLAVSAMKALNIEAKISPVRGGTDGSRLSFDGLPTPNLFTGGENFHGRHEFAVVETMEAASNVIVKIAETNTKI